MIAPVTLVVNRIGDAGAEPPCTEVHRKPRVLDARLQSPMLSRTSPFGRRAFLASATISPLQCPTFWLRAGRIAATITLELLADAPA